MTYNEYDALTDKFDLIKEKKRVPAYWPTVQQIDSFESDPDKWILLCCYFYECNPAPSNAAEKYSKKNLAAFISNHLTLVDNEEGN